MLVYHREPMGYTCIEGKRIYGKYFAGGRFGPSVVTRATYLKFKGLLEEFTFTSDWLSRKYDKEFPPVSFTPYTFWTVDFKTVIDIARLIGIDYKSKGNREYSDIEKRALRRSVLGKLEGDNDAN
jgi:hypothetical protein